MAETVRLGSFAAAPGDTGAEAIDIDAMLPPRIEWISPARSHGTRDDGIVTVQARLDSSNGELTELKLLLNGNAIHHYELSDGTRFSYEEEVELNPGEIRFSLYAGSVHSGYTSEERIIRLEAEKADSPAPAHGSADGDDGLAELLKPGLYMLAVGVSDFAHAGIPDLEYCDDGATVMAAFFEGQEGGLFAKTEIRLLTNGEATEGVQDKKVRRRVFLVQETISLPWPSGGRQGFCAASTHR